MNAWIVFSIVFACISGGILLGIFLRRILPVRHLNEDAKEVVRLGTGLVGTIAALVLGLLIASAKNSFDTQNSQVKQLTGHIIMLDGLLGQYGPQAAGLRDLLRRETAIMADRIWQENASGLPPSTPFEPNRAAEAFFQQLLQLAAGRDDQRFLKERMIHASIELARIRVLLFVQEGSSIPTPFLAVLVIWLTIIFASFSLFAEPNPIVIGSLFIFALSAAGAIFMILELGQPFDGILAISNAPLRNALAPLGS